MYVTTIPKGESIQYPKDISLRILCTLDGDADGAKLAIQQALTEIGLTKGQYMIWDNGKGKNGESKVVLRVPNPFSNKYTPSSIIGEVKKHLRKPENSSSKYDPLMIGRA